MSHPAQKIFLVCNQQGGTVLLLGDGFDVRDFIDSLVFVEQLY